MTSTTVALIALLGCMWLLSIVIAFCVGKIYAYRDAQRIIRGEIASTQRDARVTR